MAKKLLATLLCFFLLSTQALAVTRVTYVNEPIEQPDLYVTKTVTNAVEDFPAPADDVFSFTIEVGDATYKNEYFSVSTSGSEYSEYDESGNPYQTDRYGRFSLKDGQTACFPYIGNNIGYTVTEDPKENYQQEPSSGVISGYTKNSAEAITFTNTYIPKVAGETTSIEVHKHILFPQGYVPPETPEFEFLITVDGSPYKSEEFDVYDGETGLIIDTKSTNYKGIFTLEGGQYAVFKDIPVDVDYTVTEETTEKNPLEALFKSHNTWHVVGKSTAAGATQAPVTRVDFTNTEASFGVSKELADGSISEDEFTFTLFDANHVGMKDAKYYLYDISGYQVDNEIHTTNKNGEFKLKPGQVAIFIGITPGTQYGVVEAAAEGFTLLSPSAEGYQNKEVSDTAVILPFVNKPDELTGALSVIKQVKSVTGDFPNADDVFTFKLEQLGPDGQYTAVTDAVYSVAKGDSTYTYKTDDVGNFSIKANERALFSSLKLNETYKVTEETSNLSKWYTPEIAEKEGVLTTEGLSLQFTNLYEPDITLQLHKVDASEKSTPLAGVKFSLYYDEKNTQLCREGVTDSYGNLIFKNLAEGTYYLVETETIAGYWKLSGDINISLTSDASGMLNITADSKYSPFIDKETGAACLTIPNRSMTIMPNTGGPGIVFIVSCGIILLGTATVLIIRKNKDL